MKPKYIIIIYILLSFCLFACQKNEDNLVSEVESSCELKSPNGSVIAKSVSVLKERLCNNIALSVDNFEIVEIDYADVLQGFVACVTYLTKDGNVGRVGVTNHLINSQGEVMQDDIPTMLTRSETDILDLGGGNLVVCRAVNTGCMHCIVEFDISSSGQLSYKCGCRSGSDGGGFVFYVDK